MARTARKQEQNRRRHLNAELAAAETSRDELCKANGALVAAALQTGTVRAATNHVLSLVNALRQGDTDEVAAARRRRALKDELAAAATTKDQLWLACRALIAAAKQTGHFREVTDEVLAIAARLRTEAVAA